MIKKPFPMSLLVLILFIAVVNGLANEFSWYWRIPWLDMPMHFLGGLWVGSAVLWFYSHKIFKRKLSIYLVSLSAVLLVGGLWELFEFNVNTWTIVTAQNGILDTSSDIAFDIIGGITATVYFIFKNKKNG
jgi:uncharacterized membrane protein YjdF